MTSDAKSSRDLMSPPERFQWIQKLLSYDNDRVLDASYIDAAKQGDQWARWMTSQYLLENGNEELAAHYLKLIIEGAGVVEQELLALCQHELGELYENGLSIAKFCKHAYYYYQLAADGLAIAQYRLGEAYYHAGCCCRKREPPISKKSAAYFKRAADAGHRLAQ